jgi:site-specific DNA-methyltransferase (adenine-specific)
MARYCKEHGKKAKRPYFSLDGISEIEADEWDKLRAHWNHRNGLTNVWTRPPLADSERVRIEGQNKTLHLNQKPIEFMERQIYATTEPGGIVWEPFGGLCSASVAAIRTGRYPCAAEFNSDYAEIARQRLIGAVKQSETAKDSE